MFQKQTAFIFNGVSHVTLFFFKELVFSLNVSSIDFSYFEVFGLLERETASQVPDISRKRSGLLFKDRRSMNKGRKVHLHGPSTLEDETSALPQYARHPVTRGVVEQTSTAPL
jgi:hypothetical protein